MRAGRDRAGSKRKRDKESREKQINGVRDRALEIFGNGVG